MTLEGLLHVLWIVVCPICSDGLLRFVVTHLHLSDSLLPSALCLSFAVPLLVGIPYSVYHCVRHPLSAPVSSFLPLTFLAILHHCARIISISRLPLFEYVLLCIPLDALLVPLFAPCVKHSHPSITGSVLALLATGIAAAFSFIQRNASLIGLCAALLSRMFRVCQALVTQSVTCPHEEDVVDEEEEGDVRESVFGDQMGSEVNVGRRLAASIRLRSVLEDRDTYGKEPLTPNYDSTFALFLYTEAFPSFVVGVVLSIVLSLDDTKKSVFSSDATKGDGFMRLVFLVGISLQHLIFPLVNRLTILTSTVPFYLGRELFVFLAATVVATQTVVFEDDTPPISFYNLLIVFFVPALLVFRHHFDLRKQGVREKEEFMSLARFSIGVSMTKIERENMYDAMKCLSTREFQSLVLQNVMKRTDVMGNRATATYFAVRKKRVKEQEPPSKAKPAWEEPEDRRESPKELDSDATVPIPVRETLVRRSRFHDSDGKSPENEDNVSDIVIQNEEGEEKGEKHPVNKGENDPKRYNRGQL